MIQQAGERSLIAVWKQGYSRGSKPIRKRWCTDPVAVALIFDHALLLELSKMMPYSVERDSQSSGKLFGGQPLGQLQLGENRTANAAISKRGCGILRGGRGTHTAIISRFVGIVNLGSLLVRIHFFVGI
jgi:hypothetical protein